MASISTRATDMADKLAGTGSQGFDGETTADRLFTEVYGELRRMARREHNRNPSATLNTTAVVHEAWLKLCRNEFEGRDRTHYLCTAARAMRQVLVDYARYQHAGKRDSDKRVPLWEMPEEGAGTVDELLAMDQALDRLGSFDDRLAELVSLRFFAGLTLEEAADCLDISARTAARDWKRARAYLKASLTR